VRERRTSWALGIVALVLTVPSVVALSRVDEGVTRATAVVAGVPVTTLVAEPSSRHPVVVVAHGFAGSAQLMDDLGLAIARAGYATVLLDVSGHGRNGAPLPAPGSGAQQETLQRDLAAVVGWSLAQPWADPAHLALVGHSMGAGAVVRAAVDDADGAHRVGATVAISLPSADALPDGRASVPRDLLLLVGGAEQQGFTDAALAGLRAAYPDASLGDDLGSSADGTARSAQVVPRADHITILFSSDTYQRTVDWLDTSVGAPSSGHPVGGSRVGWLLLLTVGAAVGFVPLARLAFMRSPGPLPDAVPVPWLVVVGATLGASAVASLIVASVPSLVARVPLVVGGHVLLWFAVAGAGAFAVQWLLRRRTSARAVDAGPAPVAVAGFPWGDLVATLAMTSYAVVALGLVARHTWTAFTFAGERGRWLLLVEVALLVWFWADDRFVRRRWWLGLLTRAIAVAVLLVSVRLLGAPGFLTLLVPLMAVVLALLLVYGQTVARRARLPWAAALVQAIPLAYLVTTTFPLAS
jgi:dienelactone hydrolase